MHDISVVVPVYNDPDGIQDTLESIQKTTYPPENYEVIVIDNQSTDHTKKVIEEFSNKYENIRLFSENTFQSSYAARNKGVSKSSGEIVAFIDSDMLVPDSWLSDIYNYFYENRADYVGCNVQIFLPDNYNSIVGRYNKSVRFPVALYIKNMNFAPTSCLVVRRSVIEEVGLFDQRLTSGGDIEFGHRVAESGYIQKFAKEISVYHPARVSLRENIKKSVRLGKGREQRYRCCGSIKNSRPWYDPRNILPPNPYLFYNRASDSCNIKYLLIFYLFDYFFKIFKFLGRIKYRLEKESAYTQNS